MIDGEQTEEGEEYIKITRTIYLGRRDELPSPIEEI